MARFTKGNGLGNDYLVMEERDIDFPLGPAAVRWICHLNWGFGSDGILLRTASGVADVGLRIFNPDGSEAEKSGNGLRIFAKYLWERGGLQKSPMRIETKGGVVEAVCHLAAGRVDQVTVEMGHATFRAPEIPMNGPDREVVGVPLQVGDRFLTVTAVSVGNPHCVIFTDRLDDDEVRQLGPRIETHAAFPNRTNVQFARVLARDRVEIRIWERGAGHTLSSGTGSCASAVAAALNNLTERSIRVRTEGGVLRVDWRSDDRVLLTASAEVVYEGRWLLAH